jgi:hypothetical protein
MSLLFDVLEGGCGYLLPDMTLEICFVLQESI